ncbi:helix-turn-helix domain-containing protein [Biostraticola tofi]|uniref:XRE family transcriptional regulator n=1 Tax=Biostraticola tofi TaxID=466109 RepID=A0A4V2W3N6_9GAMM|nr:XRE family transcriptional regulator [Biostraticola tofi]TCV92659.1 XRE family transcriptional regulator [Biostraticola tofi]
MTNPPYSEADSRAQIAQTLKERRRELAISLQTLSTLSGVSVSMISRTERGEVTPSSSVLSRLVNALDLNFATLMGQKTADDIVVITEDEQPVFLDKKNHFTRRCLSPMLPGRGIDMVKVNLGGHCGSGDLVGHTRPVEEYIYLLRGELEVTVGEQKNVLLPGDSMYYSAGVKHGFFNPKAEECEFILVIDAKQK